MPQVLIDRNEKINAFMASIRDACKSNMNGKGPYESSRKLEYCFFKHMNGTISRKKFLKKVRKTVDSGCADFILTRYKKWYPESMQNVIDDKNERIKKLEAELIKLIELAQQCDGWEYFPSEPLDEAYLVLENKAT